MYQGKPNALRALRMVCADGSPKLIKVDWEKASRSDTFEAFCNSNQKYTRAQLAMRFTRLKDRTLSNYTKHATINADMAMSVYDAMPSGRVNPMSCFFEQNLAKILSKCKEQVASEAELEFRVTTELIIQWNLSKERSRCHVDRQVKYHKVARNSNDMCTIAIEELTMVNKRRATEMARIASGMTEAERLIAQCLGEEVEEPVDGTGEPVEEEVTAKVQDEEKPKAHEASQ
eukprot:TRINITY_DN3963_c0_g1_i1.p1 TRINITY_DN3963_c0_g1~~TRINITY_DN3963_c0_g1_i1.p1  ORF type:complete len:261 (+),score=53.29 TRINITY_DN3963_c0_g1_i1:92-784(+)